MPLINQLINFAELIDLAIDLLYYLFYPILLLSGIICLILAIAEYINRNSFFSDFTYSRFFKLLFAGIILITLCIIDSTGILYYVFLSFIVLIVLIIIGSIIKNG